MRRSVEEHHAGGHGVRETDLSEPEERREGEDDTQHPDGNNSRQGSLCGDDELIVNGLLEVYEAIHRHECEGVCRNQGEQDDPDPSLAHAAPRSVAGTEHVLSSDPCGDVVGHHQQVDEEVGDRQVEHQHQSWLGEETLLHDDTYDDTIPREPDQQVKGHHDGHHVTIGGGVERVAGLDHIPFRFMYGVCTDIEKARKLY